MSTRRMPIACAHWAIARPAAVLFLDIAGFTEITDRFAQQAEFGAEQLLGTSERLFPALTDVVDAFGGDIVTFTGDGFLAAWNADDGARATRVAAQCALATPARNGGAWKKVGGFADTPTDLGGCRDGLLLQARRSRWRLALRRGRLPVRKRWDGPYRKAAVGEIALCESRLAETRRRLRRQERHDGIFRLSPWLRAPFEPAPALEASRTGSDHFPESRSGGGGRPATIGVVEVARGVPQRFGPVHQLSSAWSSRKI